MQGFVASARCDSSAVTRTLGKWQPRSISKMQVVYYNSNSWTIFSFSNDLVSQCALYANACFVCFWVLAAWLVFGRSYLVSLLREAAFDQRAYMQVPLAMHFGLLCILLTPVAPSDAVRHSSTAPLTCWSKGWVAGSHSQRPQIVLRRNVRGSILHGRPQLYRHLNLAEMV